MRSLVNASPPRFSRAPRPQDFTWPFLFLAVFFRVTHDRLSKRGDRTTGGLVESEIACEPQTMSHAKALHEIILKATSHELFDLLY